MFSREERSGLYFVVLGGGLLVVVLLLVLGFFSEPVRPAAPPAAAKSPPIQLGVVTGRVVDARSGLGLATRLVEVEGLDGLSDHWQVDPAPDQPGRFEIRGLPAQIPFALRITAAGHVAARRALQVAAGATTALDDLALTPLLTLGGTVVDSAGDPLAGVEVTLAGPDGATVSVRADARGAFRANALAPGEWSLSAHAAAEERTLEPVVVAASDGGDHSGLVLELFLLLDPDPAALITRVRNGAAGPAGTLLLHVVDATGAPLAGARVEVPLPDGTHLTRFTNRAGACSVQGLAAGHHEGLAVTCGTLALEVPAPFDIAADRTTELTALRCVPRSSDDGGGDR